MSFAREFAGGTDRFPQLHRHHRAFIALSPFPVIASADRQGVPDVSRAATSPASSPCWMTELS
jgi:predicted pyridoxine 5'-phosphate oxidase superfamily flavin-nucleotide-binding protein